MDIVIVYFISQIGVSSLLTGDSEYVKLTAITSFITLIVLTVYYEVTKRHERNNKGKRS